MAEVPSLNDLAVAMLLAYHQTADSPLILDDPLATRVIGLSQWMMEQFAIERLGPRMRLLVVASLRYAEDTIAAAVAAGTQQIVLVNSGLTTFPYRQPPIGATVFEVADPAALEWKRARLGDASIPIPPNVRFVPSDPMYRTLDAALADAGFDRAQPSCWLALSTIIYLDRPAVEALLKAIGALPGVTELIFDYIGPSGVMSDKSALTRQVHMEALATAGEPWVSFFHPDDVAHLVELVGLVEIEDLGVPEILDRYIDGDPPKPSNVPIDDLHLVRAISEGSAR